MDPNAMLHRNIVLKSPAADEAPDVFVAKVTALLSTENEALPARYEYAGVDDESHVWEEVPERESNITFTVTSDGHFLQVGGLDRGKVERVRDALAPAFSSWTVPELVAHAAACSDADAYWIIRLSAAADGPFDAEVAATLQRQLEIGGTAVRHAAAKAAFALLWTELLPAMRAAAARERYLPVKRILAFAVMMLDPDSKGASSA